MKLAELFETVLNEGHAWSILPATMTLYNKRTVTLLQAAAEWDHCTILLCKNSEGRTCFVSSSGSFDQYKDYVGKTYDVRHDQTQQSKGRYTVFNVVEIKNGEIVHQANDKELGVKASLSVFK